MILVFMLVMVSSLLFFCSYVVDVGVAVVSCCIAGRIYVGDVGDDGYVGVVSGYVNIYMMVMALVVLVCDGVMI